MMPAYSGSILPPAPVNVAVGLKVMLVLLLLFAAVASAAAASLAFAAPGRFSPAASSSVKPCFLALLSQ